MLGQVYQAPIWAEEEEMYRKDLLAIIKEAWAVIEYWSNYTYEDESVKMTAASELRFWRKQVTEVREVIKNDGLWYFFQEPMVILFQFIMFVVFWGILIYGYTVFCGQS